MFFTSAPWPTPRADCTPTHSSAPMAPSSTRDISSAIGSATNIHNFAAKFHQIHKKRFTKYVFHTKLDYKVPENLRWFNVDCAASEALYSLNSEIAAQVRWHNDN